MRSIARQIVINGWFPASCSSLFWANRLLGPTHCMALPRGSISAAQRGITTSATALDALSHVVGSNQFTQGGLTLMVVGACAALAKTLFDHVVEMAQRRLFVRADIDSRDDIYRWIMHYLSEHPDFKDSSRVSMLTSLAGMRGMDLCFPIRVTQTNRWQRTKLSLLHSLWYLQS